MDPQRPKKALSSVPIVVIRSLSAGFSAALAEAVETPSPAAATVLASASAAARPREDTIEFAKTRPPDSFDTDFSAPGSTADGPVETPVGTGGSGEEWHPWSGACGEVIGWVMTGEVNQIFSSLRVAAHSELPRHQTDGDYQHRR